VCVAISDIVTSPITDYTLRCGIVKSHAGSCRRCSWRPRSSFPWGAASSVPPLKLNAYLLPLEYAGTSRGVPAWLCPAIPGLSIPPEWACEPQLGVAGRRYSRRWRCYGRYLHGRLGDPETCLSLHGGPSPFAVSPRAEQSLHRSGRIFHGDCTAAA